MKPPARSRKGLRQVYIPQCTSSTWTLEEKRRLLKALRMHATLDSTVLQKHIPARTVQEVDWTVQAYMIKAKDRAQSDSANKKEGIASLDVWLDKCTKELGSQPDLSSKIIAVTDALAIVEEDVPPFNYHSIYSYLSAVLRGASFACLLPENAYILLQLLDHVAKCAARSDTSSQSSYLSEKYASASAAQVSDLLSTTATHATDAGGSGSGCAKGPATPASVVGLPAAQLGPQSASGPVVGGSTFTAQTWRDRIDFELQRIKSLNPLGIPPELLQPKWDHE